VRKYFVKYFEITFWTTALISLALMPPSEGHYSLCIFKLSGITFCPGCGLGHSINDLFHGQIEASLAAHPLGIFAVVVIVGRILKLFQLKIL